MPLFTLRYFVTGRSEGELVGLFTSNIMHLVSLVPLGCTLSGVKIN